MSFISGLMLIFSMIAALDRIIGNRFGLGKEFEKGFIVFGSMAIPVIGMSVICPYIADVLSPLFDVIYNTLGIDPSIIPSSLFANDMGGSTLSVEVARNSALGMFNGLVVSSMMGATISFNIPFALGVVKKELHRELFLGILCGIATIPVGCFVSGLISGIPVLMLTVNLLPLIIFAGIIAAGLMFVPDVCIKVFSVFEKIIRVLVTAGMALGIIKFLTGYEVLPGIGTIETGAAVCLNAAVVMTGAFPLIYIVAKILKKPLGKLADVLSINKTATAGFFSSIATSVTTFQMMNDMDKKGTMLNSAFAVSASFVFAGHLAYTMAFNAEYVAFVIIGKLISGFSALCLAICLYKRVCSKMK